MQQPLTIDANRLWQLYQQSFFSWSNQPLAKDSFAIITACNPMGRQQSNPFNMAANTRLASQINPFSFQQILAGNQNFSHCEPSFAIAVNKEEGRRLALGFDQLAYFWVQEDRLWLEPARLEGYAQRIIGSFSQRLISNKG